MKRTDFGAGRIASPLYLLGGAIVFSLVYNIGKIAQGFPGQEVLAFVGVTVVGTLVSAGVAGLGGWFSRAHKRREQAKRDKRAATIMDACATNKGNIADFSVYLRSFEITGRMPFEGSMMGPMDARAEHDKAMDFETSLAAAVEKDVPLVALGKPGEQLGAGRILSDEEHWKTKLETLVKAATLIFVIPSVRPGTLWEIDWIIENRALRKTLWIQPPMRGGWMDGLLGLGRTGGVDWKLAWEPIAAKLLERGISAPAYQKNGAIFTIGKDNAVNVTDLRGYADARGIGYRINDHLLKFS